MGALHPFDHLISRPLSSDVLSNCTHIWSLRSQDPRDLHVFPSGAPSTKSTYTSSRVLSSRVYIHKHPSGARPDRLYIPDPTQVTNYSVSLGYPNSPVPTGTTPRGHHLRPSKRNTTPSRPRLWYNSPVRSRSTRTTQPLHDSPESVVVPGEGDRCRFGVDNRGSVTPESCLVVVGPRPASVWERTIP